MTVDWRMEGWRGADIMRKCCDTNPLFDDSVITAGGARPGEGREAQ